MPLAIKPTMLVLQKNTLLLLAGRCPCFAAVLVTFHTGGTQLEGLTGLFPSSLKGFAGETCLTESSAARSGIQAAFHVFVSMAKYEKTLCSMSSDHKTSSRVAYKLFCQPVAFPAAARGSALFLQVCWRGSSAVWRTKSASASHRSVPNWHVELTELGFILFSSLREAAYRAA